MVIAGAGVLAEELRAAATEAGYEVRSPHAPKGGVLPSLVLDCEAGPVTREQGLGAADGRPERRGDASASGRRACAAVRAGLAGCA